MPAYFMTRINVGDYDQWKPQFDQDTPGARKDAKGYRLLRSVDNPGEVFVMVEFATLDAAKAGRDRLVASGVLDRFADRSGPYLVEESEAKAYS